MSPIFVDTLYWIATINPRDQWHASVLKLEASFSGRDFITTESVLVEVLNYFSAFGPESRLKAARVILRILQRPDVETLPQTHERFLTGIALYEARLDKSYSLTDCVSMNVMRERSISDVLTHDDHFTQEGFKVLL